MLLAKGNMYLYQNDLYLFCLYVKHTDTRTIKTSHFLCGKIHLAEF